MKLFWKQFGKAVCYGLLFFGTQIIVTMAIMIVMMMKYILNYIDDITRIDEMQMMNDIMQEFYACANLIVIASGIITIVVLIAIFLIRRKNIARECGLIPVKVSVYLWSALLGASLSFVIMFVLAMIPAEWMAAYEESSSVLVNDSVIIMILSTVIVAPISEEIVFRGLVLSRLQKALPAWAVALITSVGFGLLHGQIIWILYAFVLSLVLCLVAARQKSILPTIVIHLVFNFFGSFIGYLNIPGIVILMLVGMSIAGTGVSCYMLLRKGRSEAMLLVVDERTPV